MLVLLQDGLAVGIQFYPKRVNGLDGCYLDVLVMYITLSEIRQIRIPYPCIALEKEYSFWSSLPSR